MGKKKALSLKTLSKTSAGAYGDTDIAGLCSVI